MTLEKSKSYLMHMLAMMAIEPPKDLIDERDIKEWEDEHSKIRETLECSLSAVEKQIPKKIVNRGQGHEAECLCPNCGKYLGDDADWTYDQTKYCSNCGQALEEYH